MGLFFVAKGIFTILAWLAPILLVATAVIDYKIILNYGKWLLSLLQKNLLLGIGGILLTVFGFPIIAGFLFVKALLYRKVKNMNQGFGEESTDEFLEYEEIEEDVSTPLELPDFKNEETAENKSNDYEQLF